MGDVAMWTGIVTGTLMCVSPLLFKQWGWRGVAGATPAFLLVAGTPFFLGCIVYAVLRPSAALGIAILRCLVMFGALLQVLLCARESSFNLNKSAAAFWALKHGPMNACNVSVFTMSSLPIEHTQHSVPVSYGRMAMSAWKAQVSFLTGTCRYLGEVPNSVCSNQLKRWSTLDLMQSRVQKAKLPLMLWELKVANPLGLWSSRSGISRFLQPEVFSVWSSSILLALPRCHCLPRQLVI